MARATSLITRGTAIRGRSAIEILLSAPMRISNLAQLELGRHVQLGDGRRSRTVRICIDGEQVKNGVRLDYELPSESAWLIRDYVRHHLPVLGAVPGPLFPGVGRRVKHVVTLGGQVRDAIREQLGIAVNPHLFRHFAAKLYLDAHPGEFATVARLLGHRSVQTTLDFYAAFDNEAAAKRYHDTVLSPRRKYRGA